MANGHRIPLNTVQPYQSLRSTVIEALRTAIIVGDLAEGELYSAPALAEPLGVSATPVREAMMDLAGEGLVTVVKNKGFRVTEMTAKDLEEMVEVRQLLEPPAVRDVVGRIPREELDVLRLQAQRIVDAAEYGDLRTYLSVDRQFHADILRHTGNQRLVALATKLRAQTRLKALRPLVVSGELVGSAREHAELLDLMEAGDAEGAYQLVMRHIGHASRLWSEGTES